jgi:phosphopantetheine adenylyltransferase
MESEEKKEIEDYSEREKEIRDYVEKWGPDADI